MNLLGITGKAGVGKDTAANHLVKKHGWVKLAFARPLKNMLHAGLGLDPNDFDDRTKKEAPIPGLGVSYRHLAQTLGTEWGRQLVRDDLWLWAAEQMIKQIERTTPHSVEGIVFSDLRFENEADFIRNRGGLVLHIDANRDVGLNEKAKAHVSEAGVKRLSGDPIIQNDKTVETLYWALDWMLADLPVEPA